MGAGDCRTLSYYLNPCRPIVLGGRKIKTFGSKVKNDTYDYFVDKHALPQKVKKYILTNWKFIIASILAWSVVIGLAGALYGFKAVALPLVIGGAFGLGIGIIISCFVVAVIRPEEKHHKYMSIWGTISTILDKLDPHGTRPTVIAVASTVMLAACVVFPYFLAFIVGLVIANHVFTQMLLNKDKTIPDLQKKIEDLNVLFEKLQNKLTRDLILETQSEIKINLSPYLATIEDLKTQQDQIEQNLYDILKDDFELNNVVRALKQKTTLADVKTYLDQFILKHQELKGIFNSIKKDYA